jgi:peptidoglycan hydrolase CwlO-like protein
MTDIPNGPAMASVDDLAAGIAEQLVDLKDEQQLLRNERDTINDRLKWLAGEIDKAERMTKALIPRTRSSKKNDATPVRPDREFA